MTNKNYWENETRKDKVFTAINQVKTKDLKESFREAQRNADYPHIIDLAKASGKTKISALASAVVIG